MMAFVTCAIFFVRFWRRTHDRLFGIFALAFVMFAFERWFLLLIDVQHESRSFIYLIRLAGFTLIILGILDKNRATR